MHSHINETKLAWSFDWNCVKVLLSSNHGEIVSITSNRRPSSNSTNILKKSSPPIKTFKLVSATLEVASASHSMKDDNLEEGIF